MSPAADRVITACVTLLVLMALLWLASLLIYAGGERAGQIIHERCQKAEAFDLQGERVLCLNREGLGRLLEQYEAEKQRLQRQKRETQL